MQTPLESLIACGTKLWLDSVDPGLVASNRALGATGATSNPVIVSELLQSGRFDEEIARLMAEGRDDGQIAWQMTDRLVRGAQAEFLAVWQQTAGNDGYVSFEVDPLLEDPERDLPHAERVRQYIELARHWAAGHDNRLIKVPATPAGLDSLEQLVSAGISVNVTLIFTLRQYRLARSGVARCPTTYEPGPFQERVQHLRLARRHLHGETRTATLRRRQGQVGIVNAKRIWLENQSYWRPKQLPLQQEIVFASTGTKRPADRPWKYVEAFAGSDIETNPPATNEAVQRSGLVFHRQVDQLPPAHVLAEIDAQVDLDDMERVLMAEGIAKFADPQKKLLEVIAARRGRK